MAVLGPIEPSWLALLREQADMLAVELGADDITATADRVIVSAGAGGLDAAWRLTAAMAPLWGTLVGTGVGLELHAGALCVTVPGPFFAGPVTRRRWAAVVETSLG